ncbi:hypothetical protein BG011_009480 [Mortierella polycephala]|uniref:Phospholipase n=1 Tax=Mortierella polycephala TaxID=41804 RepID=A0A9P6QAM2_9FUNG|nr:hypothetical protein BG011_009480 [Mortierella polycephala]
MDTSTNPDDLSPPVNLANLASREYAIESSDEKRFLEQPQPEPQQSFQQHLKTGGDPEKNNAELPPPGQTMAPPRFKLAGIVDRVRQGQQLQQQQQQVPSIQQPSSPDGAHPQRHRIFPSHTPVSPKSSAQDVVIDGDHTQQPSNRLEVRSQDSRQPSSISHSVISGPEGSDHGQRNRHRFHLHRRRDSEDGAEGGQEQQQQQHHNLSKIFLNNAATAFTKSNRSNVLENVDIPPMSLAVTGSAVPALWLRRDDKGRRPPAVLFQMLKVAITDSEIDSGLGKQIIFRVELQYGDVKWVIRRTVYEFYKLHLILSAKRFSHLPKFPSQSAYAISMAKASMGRKTDEKLNFLRKTNLARRQALQSYLIQVLHQLNWTIAYDLYEFLEISAMSLTKDMGWKGKEGYVETKITDKINTICGCGGVSRKEKRWLLLRDSYMAFCPTVGSNEPTDVFMFDETFFFEHKEHALGLNMHHIEIGDRYRKIEIKGEHTREVLEWMDQFNKMKSSSPWVHPHRFGSFAPQRESARVRYYVDGKDYFHAVSDAILAAKTEIYICDWWLSPELYLRRPPEKNEEFRLDRLLKKKAMEGVMIYIVVYKEVSLALTLDSAHTKIWLQDLHPNIQVQRHPDHLKVNSTQFWAHHEKICVIDCRLAFIGGLDLCFGRYDSRTHQLADYHPSGKGTVWPGLDYSNPRIKDFVNVKDFKNELIERKLLARMPWHDVSLGVAGQPARDIARHFVQRWNFVKKEKGMKKIHMKFLTPKGEFVSTRNELGWTGSQKVQLLRSSTVWSQGVEVERSIQDAYLHSITNAEHFIYIENQFFVTLAVENGHPDLKNTIGIALVNRIMRAYQEGKKFRVIVVMPLMPAFEADIMSSEAGTLRKVMHFQYVSICRGGNSVLERLVANGVDPDQYISFYGLRSFDRIKHGKFDAIVEAVKEAEKKRKAEFFKEQPENKDTEENGGTGANANNGDDTTSTDDGFDPQDRSLASQFLLDPIPQNEEAERIKAIADERKAMDVLMTWDESITKRAMNPAIREHGYIPATTECSLADKRLNAEIQNGTDEAEIKSGNIHERGETSPQLMDGFGTKMRNAIEKMKGTKEHGDLEPKHHKITRHPLIEQHRNRDGHTHRNTEYHRGYKGRYDDSDADSAEEEQRMQSSQRTRGVPNSDQERQSIRNDAESIIEPIPGDVQSRHGGEDSTEPSEAPMFEKPVEAERPIVDDEVDDFVTEQLYIHSKLMIVDDRIIICGSANINDRSQVGYRDSEIAMIIEDTEMVPSFMNGVPYQVGKMAHALRTDLFKEHLGLLPHVEHDVVTKASVLPVDLDAPNKDPEEARSELIRKAQDGQQCQGQDQEVSPAANNDNQISEVQSQTESRHHHHHHHHGHLQVYTPNEDEVKAINDWHSPNAHGDAKRAAAYDPLAADAIVRDPLHDDFYESWWKRVAQTNTEIFREVFRCVPDDTVETWTDYKAFIPDSKKILAGHVAMEGATVEIVTDRLQKVTGHLVVFPTRFLCKENLMGGAVEGAVVPMAIFT